MFLLLLTITITAKKSIVVVIKKIISPLLSESKSSNENK
jgi:hypothetical protein